jgi:DNA-binding response OmpR family regulator
VYTATNAADGLTLLAELPDLIILDVAMPEVDGITFCKEIRQQVACPVIFLSAKVDEASRLEGLMAGGDDYLLKPVSLPELGMRVKAHLRREDRQKSKKKIAYFGDIKICYDEKKVVISGQEVNLTKTEYLIIAYLSLHKGKVYSKEQIYEYLWDIDKDGDAVIITEHIRRIRTKLKKVTSHETIQTVWGLGYKWIG